MFLSVADWQNHEAHALMWRGYRFSNTKDKNFFQLISAIENGKFVFLEEIEDADYELGGVINQLRKNRDILTLPNNKKAVKSRNTIVCIESTRTADSSTIRIV